MKPWAIGAAAIVVIGVAVALITGGGSSGDNPSSSTSDSGSSGVVQPTRANALDSARIFTDGVKEENISDFEDLYKGNFKEIVDGATCTEAKQPMDVDAALAEWQCFFEKANAPTMQLTNQRTDLKTNTMTANYVLADSGTTVRTGKIRFHFIPGKDFPRMDEVVFSKSSVTPSALGSTSTTTPITRAAGLSTMASYAAYYTDENLTGLEGLFTSKFKQTVNGQTCQGTKSPMNLDAALAEYDCAFQKLNLPEMKLSEQQVDPRSGAASAHFVISDKGKQEASGTLTMHLVPAKDRPKIDKLILTFE
jgi:hypothetical protein